MVGMDGITGEFHKNGGDCVGWLNRIVNVCMDHSEVLGD